MRRHGTPSLLALHAALAVVGVVAFGFGIADSIRAGASSVEPTAALAIALGGAALAFGAVVFGVAEVRRGRARAAHEEHLHGAQAHDGARRIHRTRRVRWTRAWPWWAP